MSTFDPATFLDATIDQPLVKRPPLPAGDYTALLGDPVSRSWVGQKDPTKSGIAVDFPVDVEVPPDVAERLHLNTSTIKSKYGVMLDLTPSGGIDTSPGANGGLRRLREAIGMNKPGEAFNLRQAAGKPVRVKIAHREYPPGSGDLFEEIVGIAKV